MFWKINAVKLSSLVGSGNFTVSLLSQRAPFNNQTLREFDPTLGKHDDFLLLGRYIFAQKTDSRNVISLYISYDRQPFQKAMIPSTEPHQVVCMSLLKVWSVTAPPPSLMQSYIVSHINQQQALVIVEHSSGQYNLYLSDVTGVYFALSLPDLVNDGTQFDLDLVSVGVACELGG